MAIICSRRNRSAEMNKAGETYKLKIYPSYGDSPRDGHSFGYFGADVWAEDVLGFLNHYPVSTLGEPVSTLGETVNALGAHFVWELPGALEQTARTVESNLLL